MLNAHETAHETTLDNHEHAHKRSQTVSAKVRKNRKKSQKKHKRSATCPAAAKYLVLHVASGSVLCLSYNTYPILQQLRDRRRDTTRLTPDGRPRALPGSLHNACYRVSVPRTSANTATRHTLASLPLSRAGCASRPATPHCGTPARFVH